MYEQQESPTTNYEGNIRRKPNVYDDGAHTLVLHHLFKGNQNKRELDFFMGALNDERLVATVHGE